MLMQRTPPVVQIAREHYKLSRWVALRETFVDTSDRNVTESCEPPKERLKAIKDTLVIVARGVNKFLVVCAFEVTWTVNRRQARVQQEPMETRGSSLMKANIKYFFEVHYYFLYVMSRIR